MMDSFENEEVEALWATEVERRIAEMDAGVPLLDASAAIAIVRARLHESRLP